MDVKPVIPSINEVSFDEKQLTSSNANLVSFNYEDTPITDIVNTIILDAIKNKASDIHFEPRENEMQVRMRIDGMMRNILTIPKELQASVI